MLSYIISPVIALALSNGNFRGEINWPSNEGKQQVWGKSGGHQTVCILIGWIHLTRSSTR